MRRKNALALFLGLVFFCQTAKAFDISLKISAGKNWISWGDYILGQDLKSGLEKNGYLVQPAYMDNYYPADSETAAVDIYMHGFIPFNPPHNDRKIKILYLYYPLETANSEKYKNLPDVEEPDWYSLQTELWDFDLIAVASPTYQEKLGRLGLKTIFVPQFTNPQKFFYEYDQDKAYDILFVGRPGYERISVKWAIESGFDVALFGDGWQNKVPHQYFKGSYIDNNELHKYYASAKIVLNDTREDMKRDGFISNRIFDVTASGGFLISDYMPEIEQFYGDYIPMFKTKEELASLLEYYLAHPKEREEKAKKAQAITLAQFTNTTVAETIMRQVQRQDHSAQPDTDTLALKSPWGKEAREIGDYWLGIDLEDGLKAAGFNVQNYYYNHGFQRDDFYANADNLLYLQFKYNYTSEEDDDKAKIMYLYFPTFVPERGKFKNSTDRFIYNTDVYLNNELEYFDLIATPAKTTLQQLKHYGYEAEFVPQFTNPEKFRHEPDREFETELLFVGSPWYERISVTYAVELGYNLAVYGLNWEGKIPDKYIKGRYIDNRELYRYYSAAKIVLNDQAEDLSRSGLVINRLYDATAAGAFVISEYSPYIEEIFGDSIPLFKTKEEFKQLIDYYLAHPEEREKKARKAHEITMNGYTHKIIGEKFKKLFSVIREKKQ